MIYERLVDAAIRMLCEDPAEESVEDYRERARYLLATFCSECEPIDRSYRAAHQMPSVVRRPTACVRLQEEFPLCDVFVTAAEYYLSAMLAMEENEEMSEKYLALYSDALSRIVSSLPASLHKISDRYGLLT